MAKICHVLPSFKSPFQYSKSMSERSGKSMAWIFSTDQLQTFLLKFHVLNWTCSIPEICQRSSGNLWNLIWSCHLSFCCLEVLVVVWLEDQKPCMNSPSCYPGQIRSRQCTQCFTHSVKLFAYFWIFSHELCKFCHVLPLKGNAFAFVWGFVASMTLSHCILFSRDAWSSRTCSQWPQRWQAGR